MVANIQISVLVKLTYISLSVLITFPECRHYNNIDCSSTEEFIKLYSTCNGLISHLKGKQDWIDNLNKNTPGIIIIINGFSAQQNGMSGQVPKGLVEKDVKSDGWPRPPIF